MASTSSGASTVFTSSSSAQGTPATSSKAPSPIPEDFPFATSIDKRDVAAKSVQYQRLERALNLTAYTKQIEQLLSSPIKIPASHAHSFHSKKTFFPVKGIWPTEEKRREKMSKFYSLNNVKNREWIRDLLLDESDDDEDTYTINQRELRAMLKNHKLQRDLRLRSKGEGFNSKYAYFSAGIIASHDSYGEASKKKDKPVEVNVSALNTVAAAMAAGGSSQPLTSSPPTLTVPLTDDSPEPLSVDANFPNSTIIPLPPLSH